MMPQSQATNTQSQVNDETAGSGTRYDDQIAVASNISGQESNQVRTANFLQLANGNYWNKLECNGKILQDEEESGRFTNMTEFANDLVKKNITIGSGLA
eukprot:6297490-Ditylum_brightwellii.AAC.1